MPISNDLREQMYNGGGTPLLKLIRVNVDGGYYFFVDNTEDVVSNVDGATATYLKSGFDLTLPDDTTTGSPQAVLQFSAARSDLIQILRQGNEKVKLDLWLVLADNPNYVEIGPRNYESDSYTIDGSIVKLNLSAEPQLDVVLPGKRYTPTTFPQLWR